MKYKLAIVAAVGAIIATATGCDGEHEKSQQIGAQNATQAAIPMPDDERQFIDALVSADTVAKTQYSATNNGIRRDEIREEQNRALCKALRNHHVVRNWVAILKHVSADITTTGRADVDLVAGYLSISSPPSMGETRGKPLISWVKEMEPGQLVTFSGIIDLDLEHADNRTDCNPVVSNPIYVEFKSMVVTPLK